MKTYPAIINALNSTVLAIMPEKLEVIMGFLQGRIGGSIASPEQIQAAVSGRAKAKSVETGGSIAILPVYGVMAQRMDLFMEISGGVSTDNIAKQFDEFINDSSVKGIILEIDSPGGSVYGLEELSTKIRSARGKKPIYAIANSMMASAAYYVGSSVDEISITPGGLIGAIGTIMVHLETSAADAMEGFKYTIIKAGKDKGMANSYETLTEESAEYLQGIVNKYYSMFVGAVAKNRGITAEDVEANYGQGRVFTAKDAKRIGMVDRIETLQQAINRMGRAIKYNK